MFQALLAAALFGASAPIAKLLLGEIAPVPLAAFLYLGSGISLTLIRGLRRLGGQSTEGEARISKADIPWLAGAILAGGVAAPIVLMFGLRNTPAATASLLLNFEGAATTLIAVLVFKEATGRRLWWAVTLITAASLLLSWNTDSEWGVSLGAAGVLGACILWGIDNNLTRNVSAKDPLAIVTVKGLSAGLFSLVLALILRNPLPGLRIILGAMILGSVSYGLSIVSFILAMRELGAARTSAWFGTAPFVGALLSFVLFRDVPNVPFLVSIPIMIMGATLLLGEEHGHLHVHPPVEHEHRHRHEDRHHAHKHTDSEIPPNRLHSHLHRHEEIEHDHPHTPDTHHRHGH